MIAVVSARVVAECTECIALVGLDPGPARDGLGRRAALGRDAGVVLVDGHLGRIETEGGHAHDVLGLLVVLPGARAHLEVTASDAHHPVLTQGQGGTGPGVGEGIARRVAARPEQEQATGGEHDEEHDPSRDEEGRRRTLDRDGGRGMVRLRRPRQCRRPRWRRWGRGAGRGAGRSAREARRRFASGRWRRRSPPARWGRCCS